MYLIPAVSRKFSLGRTLITSDALDALEPELVGRAIARHANGDWGDLCAEDVALNDRCLAHGGRLFSLYSDPSGRRFYIITEDDRSVTTVLLPTDY